MTRKTLLWLVLPLLGLSILFCLLAFAPNDLKGQPELLEMSVILREGDGAASTLRKGMEQAAADLNVELRFLTLSTDNSAEEQALLLEREATGNVSAILLVPVDREIIGDAVSTAADKTTVVAVETGMTAWGASADVCMDHTALGEAIGVAALSGVPQGGLVLLLDSLPGDNGIRERLEAAKTLLRREGRQVRVFQWKPGDETLTDILQIERPDAVIAFEASALSKAAELIGEKEMPLLYGCGSTPDIADALERGRITAIAAVNVFSEGYFAVQIAAAAARHQPQSEVPVIAFSVVRKETMYQSENQKLLFPMT